MTWRRAPGFWGLVLKDSMDEIPMVYAILISVDREDVSNILAFQVSMLISQKQNQVVRQLVFLFNHKEQHHWNKLIMDYVIASNIRSFCFHPGYGTPKLQTIKSLAVLNLLV
jgi:hypothetical protein